MSMKDKRKEHPRTTMHRRVGALVGRMTVEDCKVWWDEWVDASARQDNIKTGMMVSALTGASEPSRSQNIRSYVKRKVYDKMRGRK